MAESVAYGSLPFNEQIAFFRAKADIPTRRWTDLWHEQHDAGFMVAGAYKAELLADLRGAVDKAINDGTTLAEFRRDFNEIVRRHGWSYKGGRGWRTRVIYETNLRASYQAGRFRQLSDPALLKVRPYWVYHHSDGVSHPRPLHLSWDGLTLPANDMWWEAHFTPNGWGCKCFITAAGPRELRRMGKTGPDSAPNDGTYDWTDGATGEVKTIPKGIDPGWAYTPGRSRVSDQVRKALARSVQKLPEPFGRDLARELDKTPSQPKTLDEVLRHGRAKVDELAQGVPNGPLGFTDRFRKRLREQLAAHRPIGTAAKIANRSSAAALVRKASTWYPDAWTTYADAYGPLHVRRTSGRAWQYTHERSKHPHGGMLRLKGFGSVDAPPGAGYLVASNEEDALHEYTHRLQFAIPALDDYFQELHRRRTAGDSLKRLRDLTGLGYSAREVTREDKYLSPYQGREYAEYAPRPALEVITMAFEYALARDHGAHLLYTRDREMLDLVVGLLFNFTP